MKITGNIVNLDISPTVNKQIDEVERILPVSKELKNGAVTKMGNWEKRPGYKEIVTLG